MEDQSSPFLTDDQKTANDEQEEKILTEDDVKLAQRGLPPQQYHAFVLYADEDVEFATELIERMESAGLKVSDGNLVIVTLFCFWTTFNLIITFNWHIIPVVRKVSRSARRHHQPRCDSAADQGPVQSIDCDRVPSILGESGQHFLHDLCTGAGNW